MFGINGIKLRRCTCKLVKALIAELQTTEKLRPDFSADLEEKLGRRWIPALDGLRAVAVFLVVARHFVAVWVPGDLGVVTFFVLSGFLITWLLLKEHDRTGSISLIDFYRRRALRIFPAYYCFLIFYFLREKLLDRAVDGASALAAIFYVSDYYLVLPPPHGHVMGRLGHTLGHTWSLSVEEHFYLLWPCLFLLAGGNLQRLSRYLMAAIVSVQVWRLFVVYKLQIGPRYIHYAFDARCDALLVGCLLAILIRTGKARKLFAGCCTSAYSPLPVIAALAASSYVFFRWEKIGLTLGLTAEVYLVGILLIQLIALSERRLWCWLDWPATRFLGRISYPLYLYHYVAFVVAMNATRGYSLKVQLLAGLCTALLTASASYFFIEKPFLKLKHRVNRVA